MRFSVQDLLLLTALVAFYATGWSLIPARRQIQLEFLPGAVPIAIVVMLLVPGAMIVLSRAARRRQGAALFAWRVRYWWAPHVLFAALFGALTAVCLVKNVNPGALPLAIFGTHHLMFLIWTTVVVGEQGLSCGPTTLGWEDYRFTLDRQKLRIKYRRLSGRFSLWAPSIGALPYPPKLSEELAELFAEKQPKEDRPAAQRDFESALTRFASHEEDQRR